MFEIGDRIVHPLHGAGVIEDIVERTIDGAPALYYALRPFFGDTQLFLPVASCDKLGVRPVCSRARAEALLLGPRRAASGESKGWNQRYRENMLHLRSGKPEEVVLVIGSLAARERARGLSTGEKKMLLSASQILASELAAALDMAPEAALRLVREKVWE